MRFKLKTTGVFYKKGEGKELLEKLGFTFKEVNGAYYKQDTDVTINFDTLEELIAFSKEWGQLIVRDGYIEIYDDWRE